MFQAKDLYTIEKQELEKERKIIASAKESLEYSSHSSGLLQGFSFFYIFSQNNLFSLNKNFR